MIELSTMEHLVAFADCGTLSEAAEQLHTSQPALTRSMKKLEDELGIPLFERKKNHLQLNETGNAAVEYARRTLQSAQDFETRTRAFDRSLHTISIGYCAPVPQRVLTPIINNLYQDMTLSADMRTDSDFLNRLDQHVYDLVVLHEKPDAPGYYSKKIGHEDLFFNVDVSDPLAFFPEVHLRDLSKKSILLLNQIGFWMDLVKDEIKEPQFAVQYEQGAFDAVAQNSTLPYFTSSIYLNGQNRTPGRIDIPLADRSCHVDYYLVCLTSEKSKYRQLFSYVQEHTIR